MENSLCIAVTFNDSKIQTSLHSSVPWNAFDVCRFSAKEWFQHVTSINRPFCAKYRQYSPRLNEYIFERIWTTAASSHAKFFQIVLPAHKQNISRRRSATYFLVAFSKRSLLLRNTWITFIYRRNIFKRSNILIVDKCRTRTEIKIQRYSDFVTFFFWGENLVLVNCTVRILVQFKHDYILYYTILALERHATYVENIFVSKIVIFSQFQVCVEWNKIGETNNKFITRQ